MCLITGVYCYGQEVFLGKSESYIKDAMRLNQSVVLKDRSYTNDGNVMLGYQYTTEYVTKNGLEDMFFLFGDDGICFNYIMQYYDRQPLNEIVDKIKSDANIVKLENKFTFTNVKYKYQIQIKFPEGTDGFEVIYIQKPKS
jgi:hypothetical protein